MLEPQATVFWAKHISLEVLLPIRARDSLVNGIYRSSHLHLS
jgi:hypothetical protein